MAAQRSLRIHFTREDLARTYLADLPDPVWESVLSLHLLQARRALSVFGEWRRRAGRDLHRRRLVGQVRAELFSVSPAFGYFPDFLTPPEGRLGLGPAAEAIIATPPARVDAELRNLTAPRNRAYLAALAGRRPAARHRLTGTLRRYHAAAIAPYWPDITARARADRVLHARALHTHGIDGVLDALGPRIRWRPPVLEVDYPMDRDLVLDGRGLVLLPSYFCWRYPVALADDALPPTLVYPMEHDPEWLAPRAASPVDASGPTARLLGPTRAAILHATAAGATTGDLADRVGITPAGVSQHTTTLRDAGLITSHRRDRHTVHITTPLGNALLSGHARS